MKKLLVVPLVMLLFNAADAQVLSQVTRNQFSFGPVVGFAHSWIDTYPNEIFAPGISIGMFGVYSPLEHWGVGMDARFSQEGAKVNVKEIGIVSRRLNYVRVPIRLMYFAGEMEDEFRPKLTLGPSVGYNIGQNMPLHTSVRDFDFGWLGSIGFNYRLYPVAWLNFDMGYYHGITDAIKNTSARDMNRNLNLTLGFAVEI